MSELIKIPYVGRATEASLKLIGYNTLESLKGADPELMYKKESVIRKKSIDRCQLYMYRMIVYYANTPNPDPDKLKWWYWKD
ncbi:MAG: helix-hairpin-helix domain-containing protein [Thomasclavelia sp.]|uniref:helix-hairpin-helix domain-containing protein n=1 Tax=Thomasclavelia sp. TaxID=3025757 RepID=UPI0039A3247B